MIKDFNPRLYQQTILSTCVNNNTLVVLPTGMGKTAISMMLTAQRLKNFPKSKVIILAPTKPLVEQHLTSFKKYLEIDEGELVLFTGFVKPEKRQELWKDARVIFSTPQGLENDIISGRIKLDNVSAIVFDEAHRATGDYAYTFIAKQYIKLAKYPKILGLTASPGNNVEAIADVCKNLYVEDIEVRTEKDPDVKPYIQEIKVDWVKVNLPESFKSIQKYLFDCYISKLKEVKKYGYLRSATKQISKVELLRVQGGLHAEISKGNKDFNILKSVSLIAEAMKVQHAIELIETQGIAALYRYIEKLMSESTRTKVKAVQNLVRDINFKSAWIKTENMYEKNIEHPKLGELKNIIKKEMCDKGKKIMVFNQYRDSASKINDELNTIKGVKSKIFVGQSKKNGTGLSQKEQKEVLDEFREGEINILVATSVAEEGLDIPKVDLVIFYEPVPSAIRHIQRRGRTGRQEKGRAIVLMTKGTRDEGYKWSAHYKEKRMHRTLKTIKDQIKGVKMQTEETLNKYLAPEMDIKVFADYREKGSGVLRELIDMGIKLNLEKLDVADYVLSSRCAVEYKTVPDFVDSIIDGRLLKQIKELKQSYERPIIIVEGTEDIYSQRKIHPNAIRGMFATITISYGIPILQTKTFKDSASIIGVIAKREQEETSKEFSLHGSKKPLTTKEQQEYIISALPGVGPGLAKPLLERFISVRNIVNANEDELRGVEKIGNKKARDIIKIVDEKYIPQCC